MWIAYIAFERDNGRFENVKKVYSRAVHALKDISGFEEKYNLLQAQGHLWRVCSTRRQLTGQERPHGAEETRILRRCRCQRLLQEGRQMGRLLRRLSRLASHLLLALRRLSVLPLTPCCLAHHHSLLLVGASCAYHTCTKDATPPAGAARRPSSPAAPAPPPGRADSKRHVSHPHPPRASAGSS